MAESKHPLVVWYFTDGKAGHENQVEGLLAGLRDLLPLDEYRIDTGAVRWPAGSWLAGRFAAGRDLPDPDLIVGAGRATHLPMLAARRARGGRIVVLMKPGLPQRWFDLCLIPAHDRQPPTEHVLVTHGMLNRVRYREDKDADAGLFLIGGPSPHVDWSSDAVFGQIKLILDQTRGMRWQLATSRRTPTGFLELMYSLPCSYLRIVPVDEVDADWLPEQLAIASQIWVTADSASMVYEALTAGAATGVLSVPYRKEDNRLAWGLRRLKEAGLITEYEDWRRGRDLAPPVRPLNEASRSARWIVDTWQIDR